MGPVQASEPIPLSSQGQTAGYAITGAEFESTPVLRLTHGDLARRTAERRAELETITGHQVVEQSYLHLDSHSEAARFRLDDGSVTDVDLNAGGSITHLGPFTAASDRPASGGDQALENEYAWGMSVGDASLLPTVLPIATGPLPPLPTVPTIKYVPDGGPTFPNYTWYRGCTPTAASMTEAYWSRHGRPSLMSSTDYALAAADPYGDSAASRALIDQIANWMGTDANGGTLLTNIGPGIRAFEQSKGVNRTVVTVANPTRTRFLSQIDSERVPATASFIGWLMKPITPAPGYGVYAANNKRIDHSTALMGYFIDQNNVKYMVIHDDFKLDGETIVAWNNDWSISQFDYPKN